MKYAVAAAALVGAVAATAPVSQISDGQIQATTGKSNGTMTTTASDVYVTEVVTAFTTYCPYATELTVGGSTITVSEATTLTVTSCSGGCTVTHPASSAPAMSSSMSVATAPVGPVTTAKASSGMVTSSVPATAPYTVAGNGTATMAASGTGAVTASKSASTSAPVYTGAASKAQAVGAGFLALVGLVAAL